MTTEVQRDWQLKYRTEGITQKIVLSTVVEAARMFAKHNCHDILDLGCGSGRHTEFLASRGFNVFGMDMAPSGVLITQSRLAQIGQPEQALVVGDMFRLPFVDNSFEGLVCVWTTGHGYRKDMKQTAFEMQRVLKPGGLLIADFLSIEDPMCRDPRNIPANEPYTMWHPWIGHADVVHHYSPYEEVVEFFHKMSRLEVKPIDQPDPKYNSVIKSWLVHGVK